MIKVNLTISDGAVDAQPKSVTPENLLEPDPASTAVSNYVLNGIPVDAPPWPERQSVILRPRLSVAVPRDIAGIFEAGQAAMAYGYYFHVMYTLGLGNIMRSFEAAAMYRATQEGIGSAPQPRPNPKKKRKQEQKPRRITLADAVNYLHAKGVISALELRRMHALREVRNDASHLEFQTRAPAGWTILSLDQVAEIIERLVGSGRRT